jgi:hypothetical protein
MQAGGADQVPGEGTPRVEGWKVPHFKSRQARARWIRRVRRKLLAELGACFFCGETLLPEWATLDHEVPRSDGGPDEEWNCLLACRRCNRRKGARPIEVCISPLRRAAGLYAMHEAIRRGLIATAEGDSQNSQNLRTSDRLRTQQARQPGTSAAPAPLTTDSQRP